MPIKGKQIRDSTITQEKMYILTETIVNPINVTNKEYVDQFITQSMLDVGNSDSDVNIVASTTTANTGSQLACARTISDPPISFVRVLVNGVEMKVGSDQAGFDCFFSPSLGGVVRASGEEEVGDSLYWNTDTTEFQLEPTDFIDYVYLTYPAGQFFVGGNANFNSQSGPLISGGTNGLGQNDEPIDGGGA